jgi:hypothetical protein
MRDVIWTLIVIWLIYKLVDIFRGSTKKSFVNNSTSQNNTYQNKQSESKTNFSPKKDPKDVIQKSADKEGYYIDFEEIK